MQAKELEEKAAEAERIRLQEQKLEEERLAAEAEAVM